MDTRERIVLYMVVLALAIAVGYLAFTISEGTGGCSDCDLDPLVDAIDGLGERIDDGVDEVRSSVDASISAHHGQTEIALVGIATTASAIKDGLVGLEERTADAVIKALPVVECPSPCSPAPRPTLPCVPSDCDEPSPITVSSKFTLLYENARLTKNGELTANSSGVKLRHRHLERLELLASAFGPCHRQEDPVEFRVTGFASTAEFLNQPSGSPMPESDDLNRQTANLRAQNVQDYLKNEGFQVKTKQWTPDQDLQRPYLDDTPPGMDQQALNRAVLIEPIRAGICDVARRDNL